MMTERFGSRRSSSASQSWLWLLRMLVVAAVLVVVGCAAPSAEVESAEGATPTEAEDLEAIQALVGTVVQAYNESDPDLMCSLHTEDAIRMPPGASILEGRQRICDNFGATFATYERDITMRQEEARFSGDLAVVRGTWALTQTLVATGETTDDVGTWFHVLERQEDGGWKISRSIWNSNRPA